MRVHQFGVQEVVVRVIHVRQRCPLVGLARVEDRLGARLDSCDRGVVGVGPNEVVVDDASRVAEVALQAAGDAAHPRVMKSRVQHAEVEAIGVGDEQCGIACKDLRGEKTQGKVSAALR